MKHILEGNKTDSRDNYFSMLLQVQNDAKEQILRDIQEGKERSKDQKVEEYLNTYITNCLLNNSIGVKYLNDQETLRMIRRGIENDIQTELEKGKSVEDLRNEIPFKEFESLGEERKEFVKDALIAITNYPGWQSVLDTESFKLFGENVVKYMLSDKYRYTIKPENLKTLMSFLFKNLASLKEQSIKEGWVENTPQALAREVKQRLLGRSSEVKEETREDVHKEEPKDSLESLIKRVEDVEAQAEDLVHGPREKLKEMDISNEKLAYLEFLNGDFDFDDVEMNQFIQEKKYKEIITSYLHKNPQVTFRIYRTLQKIYGLPRIKQEDIGDKFLDKNFEFLKIIITGFDHFIASSKYFQHFMESDLESKEKLFILITFLVNFFLEKDKEYQKRKNANLSKIFAKDFVMSEAVFSRLESKKFLSKSTPQSRKAALIKMFEDYVGNNEVILDVSRGIIGLRPDILGTKISYESNYFSDISKYHTSPFQSKIRMLLERSVQDVLTQETLPYMISRNIPRPFASNTYEVCDRILRRFASMFMVCDLRDVKYL